MTIRRRGAYIIFEITTFAASHWWAHGGEWLTAANRIQLSSPDVFLSHDWPSGIEQHGDLAGLLRRKPFLRSDIQSRQLGSPPMMSLLRNLKPAWWFAAHLHTRFEACVPHDPSEPPPPGQPPAARNPDEIAIADEDDEFDAPSANTVPSASAAPQNPDEIALDDEIETVAPLPPPRRETKFLALDKCLPRRQFLEVSSVPPKTNKNNMLLKLIWQVVDIPVREEAAPSSEESQASLSYDPEWLAITRAFQPYLSRKREQGSYPDLDTARTAIAREWDWVHEHVLPKLGDGWRVDGCQRFTQGTNSAHQQTEAFTALLEMKNVVR
jgi:lariat debranching enzyme